jgi:arginine N-succinyltransferase
MVPDFVFRPVEEADLVGLKGVAASITDGMTSLPLEDNALEDRIHHSQRSFDHRIKKAGGDHYLFVLQEWATGQIVGTSGIIARVGGFDPFYTYEVRKERFSHLPLGIDREMDVLHLRLDHKGPSEVCSLCLKPAFRKAGLGQLLSLARFLFMAAFPQRFDDRVIAELRGFTDEKGLSPFWESVGRHFFFQSFAEADFLSGIGQKDFIRDLMPRYPIYPALLPLVAQAVPLIEKCAVRDGYAARNPVANPRPPPDYASPREETDKSGDSRAQSARTSPPRSRSDIPA